MLRRDKYAKTLIGIDTTKNISISCMVMGPRKCIDNIYRRLDGLLKKEKVKQRHYKEIDKK